MCRWILSACHSLFTGSAYDTAQWQSETACYGADYHCSRYKIECKPKQKIALGSMQYGTKSAVPECLFGVSDCTKTAIICCTRNVTDTLTPFSSQDVANVTENCEGKVTCEGWAPRLTTTPYSIYVIMNYTCVEGNSFLSRLCTVQSLNS